MRILKLARILSKDDKDVLAEVELSISDPAAYYTRYGKVNALVRSENDVDPLYVAHDALRRKKFIGCIDWRAERGELIEELTPMLESYGTQDFDWSFVEKLEENDDCEELQNDKVLNRIGRLVGERGLVLISLEMGWDQFDFALVTPEQFSEVKTLRGKNFSVSTTFG